MANRVEPIWPMNANKIGSLDELDLTQFVGELKYDGRRGLAVINDGKVELFSRSLKSQEGKAPHIEEALSHVESGTILDGEFVVLKDGLTDEVNGLHIHIPNFTYTAQVMGSKAPRAVARQEELGVKVTFVVFDIPFYKGEPLVTDTFEKRRSVLESVVFGLYEQHQVDRAHIAMSPMWNGEELPEVREQIMKLQAEGLMVKSRDGLYHAGKRDNAWLKDKFREDYDVVIMGFTPGQGKYENRAIGAIKFGQFKNDELVGRGQCAGMNDTIREAMYERPDDWIGKVMTVHAYDPVPGSESFRMPQFKEFRDDKPPEECVWDKI